MMSTLYWSEPSDPIVLAFLRYAKGLEYRRRVYRRKERERYLRNITSHPEGW